MPVHTGSNLNVHKSFRRRPGRLLNDLCTFNLRPCLQGRYPMCKRLDSWVLCNSLCVFLLQKKLYYDKKYILARHTLTTLNRKCRMFPSLLCCVHSVLSVHLISFLLMSTRGADNPRNDFCLNLISGAKTWTKANAFFLIALIFLTGVPTFWHGYH